MCQTKLSKLWKRNLLIGLNFLGLHPEGGTGKNKVGNLKALRSEFSNGWVIGGSHPKLKQPKVQLDPKSSVMAKQLDIQASLLATISRAEIVPATEFKDFLEVESLGVEPPKRCQRCKMCKFCSDEGITLSCQEEEELKLIREGITIKDGIDLIRFIFRS